MAGKGDRYERRLRSMFQYAGWGVIRLAASGGGTDDDLPDLLCGQPNHLAAIEAKYRTDREGRHYAPLEEKEQLLRFARLWGCQDALWAARFPQDTDWYFLPVSEMETTEKSVVWTYEECIDNWVTMAYFDLTPHSQIPSEWDGEIRSPHL